MVCVANVEVLFTNLGDLTQDCCLRLHGVQGRVSVLALTHGDESESAETHRYRHTAAKHVTLPHIFSFDSK